LDIKKIIFCHPCVKLIEIELKFILIIFKLQKLLTIFLLQIIKKKSYVKVVGDSLHTVKMRKIGFLKYQAFTLWGSKEHATKLKASSFPKGHCYAMFCSQTLSTRQRPSYKSTIANRQN